MNPVKISIFIDTNILLHFKHISELPFTELVNERDIEIVITRQNLTELNKNKDNSAQISLLRDRAKKILAFLENVFPGNKVEGKINNIYAKLLIVDANPQLFSLDPGTQDNILLSDMLQYKNEGHNVLFISNDFGARKCACVYGLQCLQLPDEYMIPEEVDPLVKEIKRLKKENDEYKNRKPILLIADAHTGRQDITLSIENIKLEIEAKAELEKYSNPVVPNNENDIMRKAMFASLSIHRYSESELERYENEMKEYDRQYDKYVKIINGINAAEVSRIDIVLINEGTNIGSQISVQLDFPEEIMVLDNVDDIKQVFPPKPPRPPRNEMALIISSEINYADYRIFNNKPKIKLFYTLKKIQNHYVFEQEIKYLQHKDQLLLQTLYVINPPTGFMVTYKLMAEELLEPICGKMQIHH